MNAQQIPRIVDQGWSHLRLDSPTACPVREDRLNDAPLWKITANGQSYSLRAWSDQQFSRAERAYRFTRQVHAPPVVAVPVPLAVDGNRETHLLSTGGMWWELCPWLPGEASFAQHPNCEKLQSACQMLAHLHRHAATMPVHDIPHAADRHLAELAALESICLDGVLAAPGIEQMVPPWQADWPSLADAFRQAIPLVKQQLQSLVPRELPQQMVWGDAWHNNFLFEGNHAIGLVDFATVRTDTPVADLARLLSSAADQPADWWHKAIEAYTAVCPLSDTEHRATVAFRDSGTLRSLANWLRWMVEERRQFSNPQAVADRIDHFARRLARLVGVLSNLPAK